MRLLAHLIVQYTSVAHVIKLLHVLAAANHAGAVDLRQLQGRLALISDQPNVVWILLPAQVRLIPVLVYRGFSVAGVYISSCELANLQTLIALKLLLRCFSVKIPLRMSYHSASSALDSTHRHINSNT